MKTNSYYIFKVAVISLLFFASCKNEQVYVDSQIVMENFTPFNLFEKQYNERLNYSKAYLDSIVYNLSIVENTLQSGAEINEKLYQNFLKDKNSYLKLKEEHSSSLDSYYSKEMKKITNKLNEYFIEYGSKHQYDYIIGASGQGVLLYADTSLNITNEFIEYANARYEGFEK